MRTDEANKTLDELEGVTWGEPEFESRLVLRCHELRKKPVGQFDAADLRIMLAQKIGLPYLVPPALDLLERDPLLDAEYYEGDLLSVFADLDPRVSEMHPEWLERSKRIVTRALEALKDEEDLDITRKCNAFLARFEDRH